MEQFFLIFGFLEIIVLSAISTFDRVMYEDMIILVMERFCEFSDLLEILPVVDGSARRSVNEVFYNSHSNTSLTIIYTTYGFVCMIVTYMINHKYLKQISEMLNIYTVSFFGGSKALNKRAEIENRLKEIVPA